MHTAASALIARQLLYRSYYLSHQLEDVKPAAAAGVEALKKFFVGHAEPPEGVEQSAFVLAVDEGRRRDVPLWDFLENYERPGQPKGYRAKQFAEAMQAIGATVAVGTEAALEKFDWEGLGEATVVDVSQPPRTFISRSSGGTCR